jgi:enoyl-CoA hydratase
MTASDDDAHLRIEDVAGVRILTIDRPESKNALHAPLRRSLRGALHAADRDESIRCVVLRAVDPVFSAGVDFKVIDRGPDSAAGAVDNPAAAMRASRTPIICAVNGACVSGALELALSASFVIASNRARFADTHALLGVTPTWGLTALLPRAVGVRFARQMSLTGRFVTAAEALRAGLVNEVVDHDDLVEHTLAVASAIPQGPAARDMLELYRRGEDLTFAGALASEGAFSAGRTYNLESFTAAGRTASRRQRTKDDTGEDRS